MILFVYAVLVFLVLRFCVTLFNFLSNPKLGYYSKHFSEKVSIIVLTSTVKQDVENLLTSIAEQDYEHTEVFVQHLESISELVNQTTGKYLLFLSPSTTVHFGLINNLMYRMKVFNLAVLSLIPTFKASGFIANCIYPLNDFLLLNLLPLRLVRLSSFSAFTAGSNDCLFFDATIYKQYKWHEKLHPKALEATEIIKLAKQQRLKAEVLLANKFVYNTVDVKDTASFSMRLLMNFSNNNLAALMYLTLVIVGPVIVSFDFNPALIILPIGLIFLSRVMIAFLTAQNPLLQVLLHPLQMIMLFGLMLRGIWGHIALSIKPKK
ncbi:glycosyltransferase family 2 protein [Pedobacter hiemivivus]|uniref:Glycosyltransferase family 2 protein n=1 Tax=Pedobacter hiemivivus TaxID=2530454 RepID=A0A4R0M9W7_9SPHI|nr:glycosyltransferase family 2 protein [Pedobacter hiemivivus]